MFCEVLREGNLNDMRLLTDDKYLILVKYMSSLCQGLVIAVPSSMTQRHFLNCIGSSCLGLKIFPLAILGYGTKYNLLFENENKPIFDLRKKDLKMCAK